MKKYKPTISLLLTVLLVIGVFLIQPFTINAKDTSPSFVVDSVTTERGNKNVAVNINVRNNPGVASIALDVYYDESALSLTNFTYNTTALNGASTVPYNASAKPPCLSIVNGASNIEGDITIATLYFDVADDAKGSYDIALTYDKNNVYDINEENVAFEVINGKLTVIDSYESTTETISVNKPSFVVDSVKSESGNKNVAVNVSLKNNPGIASIALDIHYDKSVLSLTNFMYNTEALNGASTVPYNVSAEPPCLSIVNGTSNIEGDITLATLYFDISDNAIGNYDIVLTYDENNVYDINEENVAFEVINGKLTVNGLYEPTTETISVNKPSFVVENVTAEKGKKNVAVNVNIRNNPGVASIALDVYYDESALSLTNFTYNTTALNGASTVPYNASAKPPCLSIVNGASNIEGDITIATLYFDVADDAKGSYDIALTYDKNNVYDINEENIKFSVENGMISIRNTDNTNPLEPSTEESSTATTNPTFVVANGNVDSGSKNVALTVDIKNNPGIASVALDIHYDESVLTLTNFTYNTTSLNGASTVPFNASAKQPCISMVSGTGNVMGDFTFATLYFDVADNANGMYVISLTYDENNVYNINEDNVHFDVINGNISVKSIDNSATNPETDTTEEPTSKPAMDTTEIPTFESVTDATEIPTSESATDATEIPTSESATDATEIPTSESATDATEIPTSEFATVATEIPTSESATDATEIPTSEAATDETEIPTSESITDATEIPTSESAIDTTEVPTTESTENVNNLKDGYYLVGSINGDKSWNTSIHKNLIFVETINGEYILKNVKLSAEDTLKVVQVVDEKVKKWYPSGTLNDYIISKDGEYNIYFRPDGNGASDWWDGVYGRYFYVENTEDSNRIPFFEIEDVTTVQGSKKVAVNVNVRNNPGIASLALDIIYDKSAISLTGFEYNNKALKGAATVPYNPNANPPCISMVNSINNIDGDFTFATLYFDVTDNADGYYSINLNYDENNVYNINENNVYFQIESGSITVNKNDSVTEPTITEPQIVPTIEPTIEIPTIAIPTQPQTIAPNKVDFSKNPDENSAVNAIARAKSDGDPRGSKFSNLKAKVAKTTKSSNTITWAKVKGAKKYIVMGNKCGKTNGMFNAFKKLKTNSGKSFTQKGLKKNTYYKYVVLAVNAKGKVIYASKVMHVATKGGNNTNYKSLKLNKTKKTLKKGRIFKLRVTKKAKMNKKGKVKNHRKIKFESADSRIATINSKGKIKAKKKGTTYVYAYAQNGVYARIKIKVK